MKTLTARYFVYIFMKAYPNKKKILGSFISKVKRELTEDIQCCLDLSDFAEIESDYPDYVRVEDDSLAINPCKKFKSILDNALIFSKDQEVENSVVKILLSEK